ncbi:MAG: alpha/beta fold hydrolase [Hyphococcus sp.]
MSNAPDIRFFKDRDGHNIAYTCTGEGPLVICSAWWVSHVESDWAEDAFRAFFETLGQGLRVVLYDRPGVGLSDHPDKPRTLQSEAALLEDLAEELGDDQYALFAISCGGPPAILHAADHPERVRRLCFFGSYAQGQSICPAEVQAAVEATIKAHWGLGSRAMADIFLPDEDRKTLDAFARYQRNATDVEIALALLRLTYEMDAADRLGDIRAETLVLHRREDRAIPIESARMLAKGIPGARLLALDGRAHVPWVGGEPMARIANAFFRGLPTPPEAPERSSPATFRFDPLNRRLILAGAPVALTPLEFGVMVELTEANGGVVTRDRLLEAVWKQPFEGSNRIDSLIRGLRRKMGAHAAAIETVKGHGYRFTGWRPSR